MTRRQLKHLLYQQNKQLKSKNVFSVEFPGEFDYSTCLEVGYTMIHVIKLDPQCAKRKSWVHENFAKIPETDYYCCVYCTYEYPTTLYAVQIYNLFKTVKWTKC